MTICSQSGVFQHFGIFGPTGCVRQGWHSHTTGFGPVAVFPCQARVFAVSLSVRGWCCGFRDYPSSSPRSSLPTNTSSPRTRQRRRCLPGPGGGQPPGVEVVCKDSFQLLGPLFSQFVVLSEYFMYASPASTSGMAAAWTRGGVEGLVKVAPGYALVFSVTGDIDHD